MDKSGGQIDALDSAEYNGSEVHVDMFDDRLVIYAPSGMPDGTQIQERDIEDIPSIRRNPILTDIFARIGYMELTFRSNRVEFTVKLPNLNFKASDGEALNENQKLLLDILCNNPIVTQKQMIENAALSRSTVQRVMKGLTEQEYIERVGSKKSGSWIVKK